jgi:hypothetical protein
MAAMLAGAQMDVVLSVEVVAALEVKHECRGRKSARLAPKKAPIHAP